MIIAQSGIRPSRAMGLAFAVGMAVAAPQGASAQDGSSWTNFDVQAGGLVIVAPRYEGAKDYRVIGVPFVAPAGLGDSGRVQFRGPEDVRLRVLEWNGFEAGPLAGWRFDREEDDSSRLLGLGDVDGGVVVGGYAAYNLGMLRPFISYHHQVSGDDTGALLQFGTEAKSTALFGVPVTAILGASYADDDYMDAFFSVSPAQAAASVAGLGVYDAEAGIKDVFLGLSADVPLAQNWTLKLMGRYSRLVGDAADSPIVESEDQFFGGLGLTYRFDLGN